jgi:hypothetical protein
MSLRKETSMMHPSHPGCRRSLLLTAALLPGLAILSQAQAQTLPASVRACAAVRDSLARLVCYDREVGRLTGGVSDAEAAAPAAKSVGEAAQAGPVPPAAMPGASAAAASRHATASAPAKSGLTHAHLTGIQHAAGGLVLQLDNGEQWQEVQQVAGDLSLRVGDAVQIERHLGSWWLSGPHVFGMSVRRR